MKKKGFTLVELLATIAILAVLISLSIVVYNRVKENVLNKELENTISYIEAQARNYANDTNITVISVEDLILEGYIEPDDETDIYNPVTNESLNCYIVKSTYEDGKYTSTLDLEKNYRDENGKCSTYEKESNLIIGLSLDNENYEVANNNKWYKDNVYLVGMQKNSDNSYEQVIDESKYEFEWKSNLGTTKTAAKILTDTVDGVAIKIPYTLVLNWKENEELIKAEASATINIDKEDPKIERIEVPNSSEWSKEKSINIEATDGAGSGLKGIYVTISTEIEECVNEFKTCNEELETCIETLKSCTTNGLYKEVDGETKIEFTGITSEGTYQVVAIDNVGNVSEINDNNTIIIEKVDDGIDNISVSASPTTPTKNNVILTGNAKDTASGILKVGFFDNANPSDNATGWDKLNPSLLEVTKTKEVNKNGTYYFCAQNAIETKCEKISVNNIDKEGPVYVSGGKVSLGSITTATFTDKNPPITVYYLVKTTSSTPSSSSFTSTSRTFSYSCGTTYYAFAKAVDSLGNYTIKSLGSITSAACCSEGTYKYYYCNTNGYEVHSRYNECLGKTETKTTNIACESESTCDYYWGVCEPDGYQYRTCNYSYGGRIYYYEERKWCDYDPPISPSEPDEPEEDDDDYYWCDMFASETNSCSGVGMGPGQCNLNTSSSSVCGTATYCCCCCLPGDRFDSGTGNCYVN